MSKEDIKGGLRIALAHGSTLQEAMISFFNSGYPKEDIEEAARSLDAVEMSQTRQIPSTTSAQIKKPEAKKPLIQPPQQQTSKEEASPSSEVSEQEYSPNEKKSEEEYPPLQKPQTVQKVSKYGEKPSPVGAAIVFILVFFLLFLVGVLVSVFLFKDELAAFFNSFIG